MKKRAVTKVFAAMVLFTTALITNAGTIAIDTDPATNSIIQSRAYVYYYYGHYNTARDDLFAGSSGSQDKSHTGGIRSQATYDLQQSTPSTLNYSLDINHTVPYGGLAQTNTSLFFSTDSDTTYDLSGYYTANGNRNNIFTAQLLNLTTGNQLFLHQGTGNLNGLNGIISAGDYRLAINTYINSNGIYPWGTLGYGAVAGGPDYGTGNINFSLNASVPTPHMALIMILGLMGLRLSQREA